MREGRTRAVTMDSKMKGYERGKDKGSNNGQQDEGL